MAGRQGMRREFTQTKVNLKSGDAIYLSSDGYTDQNNAKGERLGRKRFEALVEENHLLPMKGQQQLLEKNLAIFQKGASQRDDIAIFGLKIP